MMTAEFQTIKRTPTMRLLVWTLCAFPLGYFFEFFAWLALGRSHSAYKLFEVLGAVYGWTIISALWAFLAIGPFRPYTDFSLRGDCRQRVRIFFAALAVLLVLFAITGIAMGLAIA